MAEETTDTRRRFLWFNQKNPTYINIDQIATVQFFDDSMTLDIIMSNCNTIKFNFASKEEFDAVREGIRKELQ